MVPVWHRNRAGTVLRIIAIAAMISAHAAPMAAQEAVPPAATESAAPPPAAPAAAPEPTLPQFTAPQAQTTNPAPETPAASPAATAQPTDVAPPVQTDAPAASPPAAPVAADAPAPGTVDPAQPAAVAPADPGAPADAAPSAGPAPLAQSTENPHLPHDLSPWNMFMSADIVVKAVMIGLAFASVVTWTVWLAKSLELTWAKRRLTRAFSDINASSSLAEAAQRLGDKKGVVSGLIDMAIIELRLSADVADKAGIKERVGSRLDGLVAAAGRDMNRGTGVLATIGSTSPFVGLFGTVWGIMNSFIGISESQTTNLAIVAPGIAEALLATAIGLVAAIPAVIIYNHFSRQIGGYKALINEASAEVMRLVSRDLDRGFKVKAARAAE
jgi:biopolymer transport protein ExbB